MKTIPIKQLAGEGKRPEKVKEIKIKGLQGQMKEGEKNIDCSSYPRGMKNEVIAHYQDGYIRGLGIGIDLTIDQCSNTPVEVAEVRDVVAVLDEVHFHLINAKLAQAITSKYWLVKK